MQKYIITIIFLLCATAAHSLEIYDLRPVGGDALQSSTTYTIIWEYDDSTGTIDLDLWNGLTGQWSVIDSNITGSSGTFDWAVNEAAGNMYRVRATSGLGSSTFTFSTGYFTIEDAPVYMEVEDGSAPMPIATQLNIFPNPAPAAVTLATDNELIDDVYLWNSRGKLVMRLNALSRREVIMSTSNYPPGMYYIECVTKSRRRLTSKLTIVR